MTNKEKAEEISLKYEDDWALECPDVAKVSYYSALEIAEWKDEQFQQQLRQQEAKLLSVVEEIVSLSAQTKSGYDFAMSIFKNEMINKDL